MIIKEKTQMENQNQNVNQEQPQGWKDVNIIAEMPLSAIVQFLNILNQRLCSVEDNVLVQGLNGDHISITKAYEIQAQLEREEEIKKRLDKINQETQGE
jgi:hypothetical protein